MKCLNCDKEVKRVEGKRERLYCSNNCKKRFQRKNKDNAKLSRKQGLENASQSPIINHIGTDHIGTASNRDISGQTSDIANYGLADCQCKHCQQTRINGSTANLNHGSYMTAEQLADNGFSFNRVSLPGDSDYKGQA